MTSLVFIGDLAWPQTLPLSTTWSARPVTAPDTMPWFRSKELSAWDDFLTGIVATAFAAKPRTPLPAKVSLDVINHELKAVSVVDVYVLCILWGEPPLLDAQPT